MSSTVSKIDDLIYWEQNEPFKKVNNKLTSLQACDILNRLILNHNISDEEEEEIQTLKEWIKSRN